MLNNALPQRVPPMGPTGPVCCDMSVEVLAEYLDAMYEWMTQMRPGGGVECPPPPGAITPSGVSIPVADRGVSDA